MTNITKGLDGFQVEIDKEREFVKIIAEMDIDFNLSIVAMNKVANHPDFEKNLKFWLI